jgi:hypothetical protein
MEKGRKDLMEYCDSLYSKLSDMKSRLLDFTGQIDQMKEPEKKALESHIPHLQEIANTIDWKLEVLLRACPYDWREFDKEYESSSSVPTPETQGEDEGVGGGFVGG